MDYAATTPLKSEVLEAMMPYFKSDYGNPSAVYAPGRKTKHIVEKCRTRVAEILDVPSPGILFTSGGTESNNAVMVQGHDHIISSPIEHESIRESIKRRYSEPNIKWVAPNAVGITDVSELEKVISIKGKKRVLASFMAVNNELGSVNNIEGLSAVCRQHQVDFHTDAVQAAGMVDLAKLAKNVDYLSLSGHKMGGPKGVGILVSQAQTPFSSLIYGGGQEQDRRAGTENVAGIVGFTKALELAYSGRKEATEKLRVLRQTLVDYFRQTLPEQIQFNSPLEEAFAPHILNLVCLDKRGKGLDGEMLILGLDMAGIYVSAGSACSSGTVKVSQVLTEIGIPYSVAKGAVRISLHESLGVKDVLEAGNRICTVVGRMSSI